MVVGQPFVIQRLQDQTPLWGAAVVYVRKSAGCKFSVEVGDLKPEFRISGKEPWTEPLTDEEEVIAMRALLMGAS